MPSFARFIRCVELAVCTVHRSSVLLLGWVLLGRDEPASPQLDSRSRWQMPVSVVHSSCGHARVCLLLQYPIRYSL